MKRFSLRIWLSAKIWCCLLMMLFYLIIMAIPLLLCLIAGPQTRRARAIRIRYLPDMFRVLRYF